MSIDYKNQFYETYKRNIYSQNGEDGVLEELLRILGIQNGYVCEFGAWDGKHLSNTFNLVTKGFKAVYIESDQDKFKDLQKTVQEYPQITPVQALVSYDESSPDSLDNILKRTAIPSDFGVLSIDVDSCDYQIWKAFKTYAPKIVVIEINSGVNPRNTEHIHNLPKYQGTSFQAMYNLAMEKGYKFMCHTGNMIFVRSGLYDQYLSRRSDCFYQDPLENFNRTWLNWSGITL